MKRFFFFFFFSGGCIKLVNLLVLCTSSPSSSASPVYLKTTHSLFIADEFCRGWMGNWLHTKVIKAYWSRHLLSILRLSTDLLYISSEKGCCSGVPCQPSHLLLLVFYVPHAIFTFLQEWASSVVNADSVYYDRKQIKYCSDSFGCRCWLYWLTISFFMRFYYPNGCDRHSTRIITTKTAVDVSQIYEPYGSLHCHVWS